MSKSLTLVVLIFLVLQAPAQSVLRLQHLNVNDGLSQSSVNYILQDSYGFMWFATGDGLDRYDGKEFVSNKSKFFDSASNQLRSRNINTAIFEDKDHKFWHSTDDGICTWDWRKRHFTIARNKFTAQNNACLIALENDVLWTAVPQSGFYVVDVNSIKTTFYPFTDQAQLSRNAMVLILNGVTTPKAVWLVDKEGLIYFDKQSHTDERLFRSNQLNSINRLRNGQLLVAGRGGVWFVDTATRKMSFLEIRNEMLKANTEWKSFAEDTISGYAYLGASNNGSICKLNLLTQKYEIIRFQNSNINCLKIDRSQNLWVGTEGNGVYKLDIKPAKFSCFTPELPNQSADGNGFMVKSIYRDDSGCIWLGTYDNGLSIYNPKTREHQQVPLPYSIDDQLISNIVRDSSGRLEVTMGNKIIWIDPHTRKITATKQLPRIVSAYFGDPVIHAFLEWKKDHYLAGTNIGIYPVKFTDGSITGTPGDFFRTTAPINGWAYNLSKTQSGELLIGKRNGFSKIRMIGDSACVLLDSGLDNAAVRHFYKCNSNPFLWIATEKGLVAYNETTKRLKIFDETSGLANSSVYGVLAQNDSSLWVSTNQGLTNIRVHYGDGSDIRADFRNYTCKDGLQSNEFNTGAFFQCPDGTMIFGGIAGINWFDPATIHPNPYKAIPAISAIYVNDRLMAADTAVFMRALTLPYTQNTISLSLRALEFTKNEDNQFAYKLDGLEQQWVVTNNDKARYSSLPPGNYTFLLKVSNNEGIWNETPLRLNVVILPPYWQTWWFYTLITACCLGIVSLVVRQYVRQKVVSKTRELEKQQALYRERLRISKDVHDDLGSGLSKISLMADVAQGKAADNSLLRQDIKNISDISRELVDNMRDLIWVLHPDNTTLDVLVARLREYCADYLDNMPIAVMLNFPEKVPAYTLSREAQRNIFLTVKEAINNCVKHSGATQITIALALLPDHINITLSDNGKGFDNKMLKSTGNGLRNMRQRIELIGGEFQIRSGEGGTTITIRVCYGCLKNENNTFV